jgi:Domain of unknown function (DUF4157)
MTHSRAPVAERSRAAPRGPSFGRRCACGRPVGPTGECSACRQRRLAETAGPQGGRPLDAETRAEFEDRLGFDFAAVRIHDDPRADESARARGALAYAEGRNLVFRAGAYAPGTQAGRRLLAHELTHVVQQVTAGPPAGEAQLEREAEAGSSTVSAAPRDRILRQGGGQSQDPVTTARTAAFVRCQNAYQQLAGIVVPGPHADERVREAQLRARALVLRIFGEELNMDQVTEIVGSMRNRLTPGLQTQQAAASDPECGNREAYVRGLRPPVVVCPKFFRSSPEQQARTMVHEAAHLARIGSATVGESYCAFYDCQTSCGGFDSADSWSHFVHCLSGQTPDRPPPIVGRPRP